MAASVAGGKKLSPAWMDAHASAPFGRPRCSSVQVRANKAVLDNCKSLSAEEIDCVFIGGLSLRQRVLRDKVEKEKEDANHVFGKRYWKNIRRMYTKGTRIEDELPETDGGESVSVGLFKALSQAMRTAPNRAFIQQYLKTAVDLPRPDFLAILKYLCTLEPTASQGQLDTAIILVQTLHRVQASAKWPEEMQTVRLKIDAVDLWLLRSAASQRSVLRWDV